MHIPSLPANVFANAASAASQVLTGAANRASSTVKSFESDLDSGNITGAQSFLSTLQQKISLSGQNSGSTAISSQFGSQLGQISNDLKSGNLAAAKTDYSQLQQSLSTLKQDLGTTGTGTGDGSSAALAAYNALQQQSAYSSALNLSMPASMPSLSVSF
jgi:hypothetical protein